jgi:magnesium-protoporphyrin IX monomethyl ester (oxidative) cyclase
MLDTDHPSFRAGLHRLFECAQGMERAKAQGGAMGLLKRGGWAVSAAVTYARLYLLPTKSNELPVQVRMAPTW